VTDQAAKLRMLAEEEAARDTHASAVGLESRRHDASPAGRVMAITSGKGGVGKTTLAVNLALLLAERQGMQYEKRIAGKDAGPANSPHGVLLVDADLGLANVDVMLGIQPEAHIGRLLSGMDPEDVAAVGPYGIRVLSGGSGLRELAEATAAERARLLGKLRGYYLRFDRVIIDTSPGIGAEVVDFLRDADEVLLVTTPEPTSLRDTYAALKMISRDVPWLNLRLVVNMASRSQTEESAAALNEVARRFLGRTIDLRYQIAFDDLVGASVGRQVPLVLSYPRSRAAASIRRLAEDIVSARSAEDPNAVALA